MTSEFENKYTKNHQNVSDHGHFTGKYGGVAYNICKLNIVYQKKFL